MKKLIFAIVLLLLTFSYGVVVEARSYSIDTIHIRSWIQPNGDLLVNEVFTYNFDREYTNLRRSFPEEHDQHVANVYAYELTELNSEPGFIEDSALKQLHVSKENGVYRTSIQKDNEKVSFLYVYTLKNAIKTYHEYSELNVTYFEDGDAHDQDFHQVTIEYILPQAMDPATFDGFLFDRNAEKSKKSQYGIRFTTPISEAYSETRTSFFFPSYVMTEMEKIKAPLTMGEAHAKEMQEVAAIEKKLSLIDDLTAIIPKISFAFVLIAVLFVVVLPQRHFWRKGSITDVLSTDILYLYFIDKIGKPHPKAFLAGLFSLVEKGAATVKITAAALRFKHDAKAPKESLVFRLNNGGIAKSAFEIQLIQWLFRTQSGSRKWLFHLHDAAGAARKESSKESSNYFHKKTKDFRKNQKIWHKMVEKELIEAGTFNRIIPLLTISLSSIILATVLVTAYYADLRSTGGIVFILIITLLFLLSIWIQKGSRWIFVLYILLMGMIVVSIINDELVSVLLNLVLAMAILYIGVPRHILSMNAVHAKDAIRSFRKSIKNGAPKALSEEEKEKWIVKAYLLGRRKRSIIVTDMTVPLATLLLVEPDPLMHITQSWKWTKSFSSSGGSSDSGGYSSGGGGGDSGGGGAGAD